jgi:hypothetical protein
MFTASSCVWVPNSVEIMNWGSVVRIVKNYGLDGPGIESQWGRDFLHTTRLVLGPTQHPVQWAPGLFPGGKVSGVWH